MIGFCGPDVFCCICPFRYRLKLYAQFQIIIGDSASRLLCLLYSHMEISNVSCMSCLMSVSGRHISYLRLFSNVYLCELFAKSLDNIRTVNTILFWRKTTTFTNNCFSIYCTVYIELRMFPACDKKVLSFANLKVQIKCRSLWDNFFFLLSVTWMFRNISFQFKNTEFFVKNLE